MLRVLIVHKVLLLLSLFQKKSPDLHWSRDWNMRSMKIIALRPAPTGNRKTKRLCRMSHNRCSGNYLIYIPNNLRIKSYAYMSFLVYWLYGHSSSFPLAVNLVFPSSVCIFCLIAIACIST